MEDLSGRAAAHQPGGENENGKGAKDIGPIGPISLTVIHSVAALHDEILRMQQEILYFENRILRKRIAIAELMDQSAADQARQGPPARPMGGGTATRRKRGRRPIHSLLTSETLASEVLPEITAAEFTTQDLKIAAMQTFQEDADTINLRIHGAVRELLHQGVLIRNAGGTLSKCKSSQAKQPASF